MLDILSISNRILARLPRKQYKRLLPALKLVDVKFGEVIYRPGQKIQHIYFPNDCIASVMSRMGAGQVSEVALLGKEGVWGIQAALGAVESSFLLIVQGEGTVMRLSTARLRKEMGKGGAIKTEILRFADLLMIQFAQTAGCNRYHPVSTRLARWLLMARDRLNSNEFKLTQRFLAYMLGVRRGGVSQATGELKKKGLIRYARGTISITNEKGLLAASCDCYENLRETYRVSLRENPPAKASNS